MKLLSSPQLRGGDKGLLRGILSGGVWNGFLLSFVKGEIVPCRFCGGPDNDGHLFGSALIPLLFTFVKVPNFVILCFVTGVPGLGVFFGLGGCLHLLVLVRFLLRLPRMMMLLLLDWRGCFVLTLRTLVENGFLLIISLTVLLLPMFLTTLTCGLMVVLFLTSYLVLGLVGVVFTLLGLVQDGSVAGGVI